MLLTLSAPAKQEFEFRSPHDFSSTFSSVPKRLSPPSLALASPHQSLPVGAHAAMSAPHRGLPPPAAMTLPDPQRGPPPGTPSLGQMPAPPSQWHGAEDSMRNWLAAKAEEDKRKQEEEKTRQESLRLEQRKIESNMLRESMAGGVPPHMVPIIFAGIGGANLANASVEWLQQYAAQLQASQQHAIAAAPHQASPDLQRDSRGVLAPGSYGSTAQPPAPATVLQGQAAGPLTYSPTAGNLSPQNRIRQLQTQGPTSAPRSALPRLTTNEMHIAQAPTLQSAPQEATVSSPSIYFHHWVPPGSQGASGSGSSKDQPATPIEHTSSPKKRKDTRAHQPAPPPTSVPQSHSSPSFIQHSSTTSTPPAGSLDRGRHTRNRSDVSARVVGGGAEPRSRHHTPPLVGRRESFETGRGRTASDSAGSRGARDERARQAPGSMPGSPRAKYERR